MSVSSLQQIKISPLRERKKDIPELANFFLEKITRKNGMARLNISPEAIEKLTAHNWPGNVRELENTIARACALASSNILLPEDLPLGRAPGIGDRSVDEAIRTLFRFGSENGESVLEYTQKALVQEALDNAGGDMKEAARLLSLPLSQLRHILHSEIPSKS